VWGLVLGYQLERDKREHEGAALWEAMYDLHRDASSPHWAPGVKLHTKACTPADCEALAALQDLA
jgi:hypothetical protein